MACKKKQLGDQLHIRVEMCQEQCTSASSKSRPFSGRIIRSSILPKQGVKVGFVAEVQTVA